jgi:hypothetical protein
MAFRDGEWALAGNIQGIRLAGEWSAVLAAGQEEREGEEEEAREFHGVWWLERRVNRRGAEVAEKTQRKTEVVAGEEVSVRSVRSAGSGGYD